MTSGFIGAALVLPEKFFLAREGRGGPEEIRGAPYTYAAFKKACRGLSALFLLEFDGGFPSALKQAEQLFIDAGKGIISRASNLSRGRLGYCQLKDLPRIFPASSFDVGKVSGLEAIKEIRAIKDAYQAMGWPEKLTPGSYCAWLLETFTDRPLNSTPPGFRALAHAALHQGPIATLRGGADSAELWDLKSAYLKALYRPVPVTRLWQVSPSHFDPEKEGIVEATVKVDPEKFLTSLGPLPVRWSGGAAVWPSGIVRGAWTMRVFRNALLTGQIELLDVHSFAVCGVEPLFLDIAKQLEKLSEIYKPAARAIYTKFFGRFAAGPSYNGSLAPVTGPVKARYGISQRCRGSRLWWTLQGDPWGKRPQGYRPEIGAYIADQTLIAVLRMAWKLPPYSVLSTHIDSIMVDRDLLNDEGIGAPPANWAIKGAGDCRIFSQGVYWIGDKIGCQGYPGAAKLKGRGGEAAARGEVMKWGRTALKPRGRLWQVAETGYPERPADSALAFSHIPENDPMQKPQPIPSIYDERWRKGDKSIIPDFFPQFPRF